jgi:hypothetical protein
LVTLSMQSSTVTRAIMAPDSLKCLGKLSATKAEPANCQ